MISRPINYIFLEGPDLAGKTTFYEKIHKVTGYSWNIQDRSALSMLVHAKYYGRDTFQAVEQLRSELYNLNNVTIILLPDWEETARRFNLRGDPIQNLASLKKLHDLFSEAAEELQHLPNVYVIRGNTDLYTIKHTISMLRHYETVQIREIQQNCLVACDSSKTNEVIGLNFTLHDDGNFSDVDDGDLLYDKEVDYYDDIITEIKEKIQKEMSGDNEYERKETSASRRFIYASDTCISLAHFLLRDDALDCKFFLRSSNVKDTVHYDLNFLKHLAAQVFRYFKCDRQGDYCKMEFVVGSGHVLLENK